MTTQAEAEMVTEQWTCMGVRVTGQGQRAIQWLSPDGDELLFGTPSKKYTVAGTYDVKCKRYDDGDRPTVTLYGEPKFSHLDSWDSPQRAEWETQEIAAERNLARRKMERKTKEKRAIDSALAPLLVCASKLKTSQDRDAFAAYVLRRISSAW